ncbi:MAG TPA: nitronate monooxygenase [Steroidobacteraceae bacterium]|nr:nitronate monooxygenase [Steroidobacteraceae bacterium]
MKCNPAPAVVRDRLGTLRAGLRLPVIAAPMFLVSGPDLVLAACAAGIGGSLPAPNARTVADLDAWLERIATGHAALQARAARVGPWALGLVTHSSYDRLPAELELVERYRPPIVVTALGSPAPVVERVHAYGGVVIGDVSTVRLARKAVDAGVDGLALICAGAGGHTGKISAWAFVPAVRRFFDGIVVVGGSIGTGGAIRAAELLGADLIYAGTPFIAARESLASAGYRDMVVRASIEDLVLSSALTGADAYYLRESIVAAGLDPDALTGKTRVDWSQSQGQLKAWKDIWSAGQGVESVQAVEPVAAIVDRMAAEYAAALRQPAFAGFA